MKISKNNSNNNKLIFFFFFSFLFLLFSELMERDMITFTAPDGKTTLEMDKKYKSVTFPKLCTYISALLEGSEYTLEDVVIIVKPYSIKYNADAQASSILLDLVSIELLHEILQHTIFEIDEKFNELAQIKRVFITNNFFLSTYMNLQDVMPASKLMMLHEFASHTYHDKKTNNEVPYFSWTTSILEDKEDIIKYLNYWRHRCWTFDNDMAKHYDFRFINKATELNEYDGQSNKRKNVSPVAFASKKRNSFKK